MKKLTAFLLCFLLLGQSAFAAPEKVEQASAAIAALGKVPGIWDYNWSLPVPQGLKYTQGDFEGSLFLGNSLAEGFRAFSGFTAGEHCTAVGMTVSSAKKYAYRAAGTDSIYLMLGINEIGHGPEKVAEDYALLIAALRETSPDADIYVQSLLPVCESALSASQKSYGINNASISALNSRLQRLCAENQLYFLDVHAALADEKGSLPASLTWDGVHLTPEAYGLWSEHLLCHKVG